MVQTPVSHGKNAEDVEHVVMIDGRRKLTDRDIRRESDIIIAKRRMTDEEIRGRMHSARPKDHEIDVHKTRADFVPSKGLSSDEAEELLKIWGRNELEEKEKSKWLILFEQFSAPMPIMIWISIIVEGALQDWPGFLILCVLQAINGFVGFYETVKAGNAVAALKESLKPQAHCKRDGEWLVIDSALIVPGDLILLNSGSAVPADCIINKGQVDIDQAALTGESLPVTMGSLDNAKMGSTVTRGEAEATVDSTGMHTFLGQTASMIQSVEGKSHLAEVILNIMLVLITVSFILCGICLAYLLAKGETFKESISFVVVLLVASIPVAMEVVVTTTMALGSRKLTSKNAIVTRLSSIEELAGMNMLCSDKTGTLTMNKMVIQEDCPLFQEDISRSDVILCAALAAKWKEPAKDALDTMVLGVADLQKCDEYSQIEYMPFDPTLKRTEATLVEISSGKKFKVTKGAPHIVLALCHDADRIREAVDYKILELAERGIRSLAVARTNEEGHWKMMGIMTFLDPPRHDTKETIERAKALGIDIKMITGDHAVIARETARTLGMGTNILGCEGLPSLGKNGEIPPDLGKTLGVTAMNCNGFAQVFPEHKFLIVEALRQRKFRCGMTGDGVNDAPALKKADVGIAVQGSTDAARAAADIILTCPGLSVVIDAIVISRCIFARMKNFIIYRVACTLQILLFFFFAVLIMRPRNFNDGTEGDEWPNFWHMPVIALILITLLNDGTIISIAYDHVLPNKIPDVWNLKSIYLISVVLGGVACFSSLLLLYMAFDSSSDDSLMHHWGFHDLNFESIVTMMYLKISLSDFMTLFASRCRGLFYQVKPGKILVAAFTVSVLSSTILAVTWPFGEGAEPISGKLAVLVWLYCLFWFFIQDGVKYLTYQIMFKYNICNINPTTAIADQFDESQLKNSGPIRKLKNSSEHNYVGIV